MQASWACIWQPRPGVLHLRSMLHLPDPYCSPIPHACTAALQAARRTPAGQINRPLKCTASPHRQGCCLCLHAVPPLHGPSLRVVQEMASPELQSLALEAKKAAALVKYMPLPGDQLPNVARILGAAPSMQPWMARGSALAFMQVSNLPDSCVRS